MRELTEKREQLFLSEGATKSAESRGRTVYEEPDALRTDFQRDRDRIIHSKSFRRLKNKTQVFLSPEGDHYRTRLTHTLDVSQIARSIARALQLNEDLAEAIALGHDLGHTPFGHAGERTLQKLTDGRFEHSDQSLRVVEVLENEGRGLNLTFEVKDGIVNHQTSGHPATLEGKVVCLSDKIAYINHDIDDSVRAGILTPGEIPTELTDVLGSNSRERINNMILSVYNCSKGMDDVQMQPEVFKAMYAMRDFLFERVYMQKFAREEEVRSDRMLTLLFEFYCKHPDELPEFYRALLEKYELEQVVVDYITGMSDRYAIHVFQNLFIPSSWNLGK